MSKSLVEKAAKSLALKREECETVGHKYIQWFKYIPTSLSPQKVYGKCNYCLQPLERGLTHEENREYEEFRQSLRQPRTI